MAISIDWANKIITIPRADLTLIQSTPVEIRELNLNLFRLELKDLEDNIEGMTFLDTHTHNTEVLLGGIVYARVIEIINGYTITFEDGQYAVNLVGANSNVGDRVNVNQVSVRSANSAGLISNQAIEFSSFDRAVTIDQNNITGKAVSGVVFPAGTRQAPVNNTADALAIADFRGLSTINVLGNLFLNSGSDFERYEFRGESPLKTLITVDPSADVLNCEFYDCNVTGTLDGNSQIENSVITGLAFVDGYIYRCAIGPAAIKLGTSTVANIFSCYSTVPGTGTPEIDMNGTGILGLRDYTGGMLLSNYSGSGSHSVDLASGQIKMSNSITSGTFIFRGVGKLVDTSGIPIKTGTWNSGVTIVNELLNSTTISESAVYTTGVYIDSVNGSAGTTEPKGLERDPVNNLADAITIAGIRGTSKLIFLSDFTFQATDQISGYNFVGNGWQNQTITFNSGCIVAYCTATSLTLTGNLTGINYIINCSVDNLGSVGLFPASQDLVVRNSRFSGTTTLPSNYSGDITIIDCYSHDNPIFNAGSSTGDVIIDNWSGNLTLANITEANKIDIRLSQGNVKLLNTVNNAIIMTDGIGSLTDQADDLIPSGTWNTGVTITNKLVSSLNISRAVWDEELKGSTHNIPTSAGRRLRQLGNNQIHDGIAQGPAVNGNQIQLELTASSLDGAYDPSMITIFAGTGAGQTRLIYQYDGANRIATVDRDWKVNPDNTSEYAILSHPGREHVNEGLAQGGSTNTVILNALASSIDGVYNYQTVFLRSGAGEDQTALIIDYDGTTKIATIEGSWGATPDSTTGYVILPSFNNPTTSNFSSFRNKIVINSVSGVSGTDYPIGTNLSPVNNLADAIAIANNYGINEFEINNTFVIGATDDISNLIFEGSNPLSSVLVITSGAITTKATFKNMIVTGSLDGSVFMERVGLQSLSGLGSDSFPSIFFECIFRSGNITFKTGLTTPQNIHFINCTSGVPGGSLPILDLNGSDSPFALREFNGGIQINNFTGGQDSTIEIDQGHIVIDSSCTTGSLNLGGIYKLTNNGTLDVEERNQSITSSVWDATISNHLNAGSAGLALSTASSGGVDINLLASAVWDQLSTDNITVDSVGLLLKELQLKLNELHQLQGLDINNPMTVTPTSRKTGSIDLKLTGDGKTTTTVERQ
jgi:hypothetical protein